MERTKFNIPNKSGIYQITSKTNGKIYIGSSSNVKHRKRGHKQDLQNQKHGNIHLQRHFNKYGANDLLFTVIELCEKEKLLEREQYHMDILKPDFNICKIAGSCLGVIRSEEFKERFRGENNPSKRPEIRQKHRENAKKQWANPLARKKHSVLKKKFYEDHPEAKDRLKGDKNPMKDLNRRMKMMGENNVSKRPEVRLKLKRPVSEETKKKMSLAKKGKPWPNEFGLNDSTRQKAFYQTEAGIKKKQKHSLYMMGRFAGDKSPSKRPEVRKKISESLKKYYAKKKI